MLACGNNILGFRPINLSAPSIFFRAIYIEIEEIISFFRRNFIVEGKRVGLANLNADGQRAGLVIVDGAGFGGIRALIRIFRGDDPRMAVVVLPFVGCEITGFPILDGCSDSQWNILDDSIITRVVGNMQDGDSRFGDIGFHLDIKRNLMRLGGLQGGNELRSTEEFKFSVRIAHIYRTVG